MIVYIVPSNDTLGWPTLSVNASGLSLNEFIKEGEGIAEEISIEEFEDSFNLDEGADSSSSFIKFSGLGAPNHEAFIVRLELHDGEFVIGIPTKFNEDGEPIIRSFDIKNAIPRVYNFFDMKQLSVKDASFKRDDISFKAHEIRIPISWIGRYFPESQEEESDDTIIITYIKSVN